MIEFDCRELEAYARELAVSANTGKTKLDRFLRGEGRKLQTQTKRMARKRVKRHEKPKAYRNAKRYTDTIRNGRVYDYRGAKAVRVYSYAPHAHLIEHGHRVVGRDHKTHGRVEGKRVFTDAGAAFESTFASDCEDFLDKVVKNL